MTDVDLHDGEAPVLVDVEFLASKDIPTEKNRPKLLEGFRVLKADGCGAAFHAPITLQLPGRMISGAENSVSLQIASLPDFLVMKAFALRGRDKPKDAYDICFCLDHFAAGISALAEDWKSRVEADNDVQEALAILREKFQTVQAFGPMQVVAFHNSQNQSEQDEQARRAFELVDYFLSLIDQ